MHQPSFVKIEQGSVVLSVHHNIIYISLQCIIHNDVLVTKINKYKKETNTTGCLTAQKKNRNMS